MFFTYIIFSNTLDKFYIGSTENLKDRLLRHNRGCTKFTSKANDWKLVYFEVFNSKSDAIKREFDIKNKKSRKYILKLIESFNASEHPDF
jgi:putative endonuclease